MNQTNRFALVHRDWLSIVSFWLVYSMQLAGLRPCCCALTSHITLTSLLVISRILDLVYLGPRQYEGRKADIQSCSYRVIKAGEGKGDELSHRREMKEPKRWAGAGLDLAAIGVKRRQIFSRDENEVRLHYTTFRAFRNYIRIIRICQVFGFEKEHVSVL